MADRLRSCPVSVGYLFGSEAKGSPGPLSDIDIAILVNKGLAKPERFDLRLRLSNELSSIMGRRVDVVVLNDAPVQLSFEIIKYGEVLLCSDRFVRVDFEHGVLSRYLDRRYYDKRYAETTLRRISRTGLQAG